MNFRFGFTWNRTDQFRCQRVRLGMTQRIVHVIGSSYSDIVAPVIITTNYWRREIPIATGQ